ncbi:hypothetical protein B0H66DRAFT_532454 [Apodospora peruviana]|uniref:Uncharacterized protein n=1 Tax=Apodospora peruviana TaxID=516989 RepID=A0AAE0I3L7_9PEZI|nr:hypothetical protein B0H66DRAFT_532454 [Apodospora peruviana]
MLCFKSPPLVGVLASQILLSLASPASRPLPSIISGRALNGAGVHLVDCHPRESDEIANSEQSWLSLVMFCDNKDECNNIDHVPATRDICVKRTTNMSHDYHKWENSDWQYCHFAERGTFSWVISRFGRLFPPATEVGIGEDNESHEFAGFRDDEFQGAGPATHNCSKVYYFT